MNVPKFLQDDLKLFSGIVSDLFPTIKEENIDYGILDKAIRKTCEKNNLKDVDGEPLAPALQSCGCPRKGWLWPPQDIGQGNRDRQFSLRGPQAWPSVLQARALCQVVHWAGQVPPTLSTGTI